jgi:hypothetical protein
MQTRPIMRTALQNQSNRFAAARQSRIGFMVNIGSTIGSRSRPSRLPFTTKAATLPSPPSLEL